MRLAEWELVCRALMLVGAAFIGVFCLNLQRRRLALTIAFVTTIIFLIVVFTVLRGPEP